MSNREQNPDYQRRQEQPQRNDGFHIQGSQQHQGHQIAERNDSEDEKHNQKGGDQQRR